MMRTATREEHKKKKKKKKTTKKTMTTTYAMRIFEIGQVHFIQRRQVQTGILIKMSVALPFGVSRPVKIELCQEDPKNPVEKLPASINFQRSKTFPGLRIGEGAKQNVTTPNVGNWNALMENVLPDEHLPHRPEDDIESLLLSYREINCLPATVGVPVPGDGEVVALVNDVDDLTSAETENDVLSSTLEIYCPTILSSPPKDD